MSEIALSLENVSFYFNKLAAVKNLSLQVEKGSFTTLLGPSGCGKTTLLRLISGFIEPAEGSIKINGIDQKGIEPNNRKVGMVFQDYALFPHLTVEQNLLFGLKLQKKSMSSKELQGIIQKTARVLGIANLLERFPHELSGGQQQRVALGRAIVLEPEILLMDEPLSSLDAKLRTQVREELQEIQSRLGITTIYVTHDQEEALSLSDTIAVLDHGKLLQKGTPRDIYFFPKNAFVADFIGRANFLNINNEQVIVRPEWITLQKTIKEDCILKTNEFSGTIISCSFLGAITTYRIRLSTDTSKVVIVDEYTNDCILNTGDFVKLSVEKFKTF